MAWEISDLETQIDAIETVLSGRITADIQQYQIAGRAITKIPITELFVIRDRLKSELRRMESARNVAGGDKNPLKIGVRF